MTDEMDAAIDRLRDTLRAEKVGQGVGYSAALQANDARIAELERELTDARAAIAKLGRDLNSARYGDPDFAWQIHLDAMADLQAELAAEEALADRLYRGCVKGGLVAHEAKLAYRKARGM